MLNHFVFFIILGRNHAAYFATANLMRIVKLSAKGYPQCEVARMLDVSQGCISKILRRNRDFDRPHQRRRGGWKSLTSAEEDSWSEWTGTIVLSGLLVCAWRLSADFGGGCFVQSIVNRILATGYQSRSHVRCPRLTLDHRRRRRVWGRTHKMWKLRHWRHCVCSDKSRFTPFHSDNCAHVPLSHVMGCHPPWWEESTDGAGSNPQPPMLHQASPR